MAIRRHSRFKEERIEEEQAPDEKPIRIAADDGEDGSLKFERQENQDEASKPLSRGRAGSEDRSSAQTRFIESN